MKIVSAILATLVMFLNAQPFVTNSSLDKKKKSAEKCCSSKQNNQASKHTNQQRNNNCCNDGQCDNPFISCSDCCFINLYTQTSLAPPVPIFKKKFMLLDEKILSSYVKALWHPPENFNSFV